MAKVVKISITRKSQVFDLSDLKSAIDWLLAQGEAVDLAECEEINVHKKMGLTDIHFLLQTTPDPAPTPPPAPEPPPTEDTSTTEDATAAPVESEPATEETV